MSGSMIAVFSTTGRMWAADLDLTNAAIGAPFKLNGTLFGQSATDLFSLWSFSGGGYIKTAPLWYPYIAVVNLTTGRLWTHQIDSHNIKDPGHNILPGQEVPGSQLFAHSMPKYFATGPGSIYTINPKGEVWAHDWPGEPVVPPGYKMNGLPLFGSPGNDFYVMYGGSSPGWLSVINNSGEVYAHQLTGSGLLPDTIGAGQLFASLTPPPAQTLSIFTYRGDVFWADSSFDIWWTHVPWFSPGQPPVQLITKKLSGGPSLLGAPGLWGYGVVAYDRAYPVP
jgi:hypothetical protein